MTLRLSHPAQFVVAGYAGAIGVGTALLMLPVAQAGEGRAPAFDALFTATSSVCVTGLSTVDLAGYWSPVGHAIILLLVQVGGFGIMTLATLLGLLVSHRLGLRTRLNAAAETKTVGIRDVRRLLFNIARTTVLFEAVGALVLTLRFWLGHDEPVGRAAWLGVFHAVSAFNNAGVSLFRESLSLYISDPVITGTLCLLIVAGGLGFPVLFELYREWRRPRRWSLHTKIVMSMTGLLLAVGTAGFLALEWTRTLGGFDTGGKLVAGVFHGVQPRTAGFTSLETAEFAPETLLLTDVLMFIGGGSAGTAGGIKVTTFAVLLFVILSEIRGDASTTAFNRRIPREAQRQAIAVALLAVAAVVGATGVMLLLTDFTFERVLFEVIAAFSTAGLSTGVTAEAGTAGQALLLALMFLGRLGPITLASALALRARPRLYDRPYDRPIIG